MVKGISCHHKVWIPMQILPEKPCLLVPMSLQVGEELICWPRNELSPTLNTEHLERRSAEFADCTSTAKALSSHAELIQLTQGSLIFYIKVLWRWGDIMTDIEPRGKHHQLQLEKISALCTNSKLESGHVLPCSWTGANRASKTQIYTCCWKHNLGPCLFMLLIEYSILQSAYAALLRGFSCIIC